MKRLLALVLLAVAGCCAPKETIREEPYTIPPQTIDLQGTTPPFFFFPSQCDTAGILEKYCRGTVDAVSPRGDSVRVEVRTKRLTHGDSATIAAVYLAAHVSGQTAQKDTTRPIRNIETTVYPKGLAFLWHYFGEVFGIFCAGGLFWTGIIMFLIWKFKKSA